MFNENFSTDFINELLLEHLQKKNNILTVYLHVYICSKILQSTFI